MNGVVRLPDLYTLLFASVHFSKYEMETTLFHPGVNDQMRVDNADSGQIEKPCILHRPRPNYILEGSL